MRTSFDPLMPGSRPGSILNLFFYGISCNFVKIFVVMVRSMALVVVSAEQEQELQLNRLFTLWGQLPLGAGSKRCNSAWEWSKTAEEVAMLRWVQGATTRLRAVGGSAQQDGKQQKQEQHQQPDREGAFFKDADLKAKAKAQEQQVRAT